ncbi:hypothetical protein KEM60_00897 [Austwickia sp. TVS 96-490-7B]|uniref:M23 family metallopeptidase n=1 Tax=Austwickia sp. TVS 96-490-7B TaxID=2830843 RepID=UPI001C58D1C0|nr:M23 family metallopeptidase [Austwickia sp. TVS 96-490-7B]MBW3084708.1 hypothetical protein [Austwickia sp. TVS 96-490-7B]
MSLIGLGAALTVAQGLTDSPLANLANAKPLSAPTDLAMSAKLPESHPATPVSATSSSPSAPASPSPQTSTTSPTPTPPPPPPKPRPDPAKRWLLPVEDATFTSGYGARWGTVHRGIDLAAPIGTPLRSMSTGVIVFAGQQSGYGNIVQIRYWDGTISYYGHMNSIAVTVGQQVSPGQVVGELGNTGQSTGPHVHVEIHPHGGADIDPLPWLSAHGLDVE